MSKSLNEKFVQNIDYNNDGDEDLGQQKQLLNRSFDKNGLILPQKIINPSLELREKKEIHREIIWKIKNGINDSQRNNDYRKAYQNYQQRLHQSNRAKETETRLFENMLEEQKRRLNSVFNGNDEQRAASFANCRAASMNWKNLTNANQSANHTVSTEKSTKNICSNSPKSCASSASGPEELYRIISQITNKSKPINRDQRTNQMGNTSITNAVNAQAMATAESKVASNNNGKVNQNDQVMKRKNETNANNKAGISIKAGKGIGIEAGKRFILSDNIANANANNNHKKN